MRRRNEKGQAIVEFALIVPIFLLLLLAGSDLLLAMSAKENLNFVVTETTRWCAKQAQPCDLGTANTNAQTIATGLQMRNPQTVTLVFGANPPLGFVSMVANYSDAPLFAGFFPTVQMQSVATASIAP
ncbi:MAG: TadE/TadG family type IV pilus assembly protein [Candidatus Acidiferrales bacterium]